MVPGSVLAIALSPQRLHYAVVESQSTITESTITTSVKWDDGDEGYGSVVVLYGPQAVHFNIVDKPDSLATRLGKAQLKDLFRGPA